MIKKTIILCCLSIIFAFSPISASIEQVTFDEEHQLHLSNLDSQSFSDSYTFQPPEQRSLETLQSEVARLESTYNENASFVLKTRGKVLIDLEIKAKNQEKLSDFFKVCGTLSEGLQAGLAAINASNLINFEYSQTIISLSTLLSQLSGRGFHYWGDKLKTDALAIKEKNDGDLAAAAAIIIKLKNEIRNLKNLTAPILTPPHGTIMDTDSPKVAPYTLDEEYLADLQSKLEKLETAYNENASSITKIRGEEFRALETLTKKQGKLSSVFKGGGIIFEAVQAIASIVNASSLVKYKYAQSVMSVITFFGQLTAKGFHSLSAKLKAESLANQAKNNAALELEETHISVLKNEIHHKQESSKY